MYAFLPEWLGTRARLLVYTKTQPVERVISQYAHCLARGTVRDAPEKEVFAGPTYVSRTRRGVQIVPYVELFGRDNVLLLIFEEYVRGRAKALRRVAEFLGTSSGSSESVEPIVHHKSVVEWHMRDFSRNTSSLGPINAIARHVPGALRKATHPHLCSVLENRPGFSWEVREILWSLSEDDVETIEELLGRCLNG
jgi:hypothetical protein